MKNNENILERYIKTLQAILHKLEDALNTFEFFENSLKNGDRKNNELFFKKYKCLYFLKNFALDSFILGIYNITDKDSRTLSGYIEENKSFTSFNKKKKVFYKNNEIFINNINKIRVKKIAHYDLNAVNVDYKISFIDSKKFLENFKSFIEDVSEENLVNWRYQKSVCKNDIWENIIKKLK